MTIVNSISSNELYRTYTNIPNTIELCVSFDISDTLAPYSTYFGGVKGCVDKVVIRRLDTGCYSLRYHSVWDTTPYPQGTTQPIRVDTPTEYLPNPMKIQQVQFSMSSWVANAGAINHYAYVWYYKPDEFPIEMSSADPNYKNDIIITIYNNDTNAREDVAGMRGHVLITLVNTYENALLFPSQRVAGVVS